MEYLTLFGIAIVSGATSSLMTLLALYGFKKQAQKVATLKSQVLSDAPDTDGSQESDLKTFIAQTETQKECLSEPIETPLEAVEQEPLHLSLLSALQSDHPKGYNNNKFSFFNLYTKITLGAHSILDVFFSKVFKGLFFVLAPAFVPAQGFLDYLENTKVKLPEIKLKRKERSGSPTNQKKSYNKSDVSSENVQEINESLDDSIVLDTVVSEKENKPKNRIYNKLEIFIKKLFFYKSKTIQKANFPKPITGEKQLKAVESKIKQNAYSLSAPGESKIITRSVFAEITMSLVPVACVILPFIFGFHKGSAENLFTYLALVAVLGSALLLYAKSPRSFWAIGITLWTAVAYYFFNWNVDSSIGPASMFVTLFLAIYAISGFVWYGLRVRAHAEMEYGLYILHPLIYLAALYLLIASKTPYIVILLYISVAALYAYFAQTVSLENQDSVFTDVAWFVSVVALSSAVVVAVPGTSEILLLSALYVGLVSKKNKISNFVTLPILFFIVLRTLDVTNSTKTFMFLFNERFVGYIVAVGTLLFAYIQTKNKKIDLGVFTRMFKRLSISLAVMLSYFAVTLEVLDAKTNSAMFKGKSAVFVLLFIYIAMATLLYMFGRKHNEKSVLGLSLVLSIYSVYFISKYLL